MSDLERLTQIGAEMYSLSGKELKRFVDDERKREKEVREFEQKREREEREIEQKREREEREREHERMLQLKQKEEDFRIAEHERKLKELQLQSETESNQVLKLGYGSKTPRLLPIETGENVDAFLTRFERHAVINKWERKHWATHLSALLKGECLEVYSRLSIEQSECYDIVKEALLKRFNLNADGFRDRFRTSRPGKDEQFSEFKVRIKGFFEKWIDLSMKDKENADDIIELLLQEQLLNVCSQPLRTFIKERMSDGPCDIVPIVECFVNAHGHHVAYGQSRPVKLEHRTIDNSVKVRNDTRPKAGSCNKCGKYGHFARECTRRENQNAAPVKRLLCTFCGKTGHSVDQCFKKRSRNHEVAAVTVNQKDGDAIDEGRSPAGCTLPVLTAACNTVRIDDRVEMPVVEGSVNGRPVMCLRDSGCTSIVVKRALVEPLDQHAPLVDVHLVNGSVEKVPVKEVTIDCPFFQGTAEAILLDTPTYDVIIGNVRGAKCPGIIHGDRCSTSEPISPGQVSQSNGNVAQAIETRQLATKRVKKLIAPDGLDMGVSKEEFIALQEEDKSLDHYRELATSGMRVHTGKANESYFVLEKGVLMRHFKSPKFEHGDSVMQVVVPTTLRAKVMSLGHESVLAGHLAAKKTTDRIVAHFYWPNLWNDVNRFCQSCDQCQRSLPKGKTSKVPMEQMPLIDEAFSRIAIDLIGPIQPASDSGHRYILTAVDFCTRYPEAVPLKGIETERVAEALVEIFSRVGIPKEILSDRGTQFTSELMREVCRLLSIKQLVTSPYHPQCNGLVERFNGTLKMMLKKMASERPRDWDRYIPAALFAYREVPQDSLGFSPFELIYGRTVRGPMAILKELWTSDETDVETKTTYQYVVDLRNRLENTIELAQENLKKASSRYKASFDKRKRIRQFSVGEKVLLLLPTAHNKLEVKWQGPFDIIKVGRHNNYRIRVGDHERTYHVNMLKRYHERSNDSQHGTGLLQCAAAAVIEEFEDANELGACYGKDQSAIRIEIPTLVPSETYKDVVVCSDLSSEQRTQLRDLFVEFGDVLTDVPGRTDWITHEIRLTSDEPIRKRPYPVPQAYKENMRLEVEEMIKADIIEPSNSAYSSPSVIVKKKDGSNRYCIDFRALNNISIFDAEPMPRPDDLFQEVGCQSKYLTKIDLSKGYWQIPLSENAKPLTAFATERGLYQFKVMPFGLQGAPATFSRLMRKVISGLDNVHNYLDDCLIHTSNWEDHLKCVRALFVRLREAGLTAKPSKCQVAFSELEFLGHMIGNGKMFPTIDKMEAIQNAPQPKTKKEMRSFLGLASFYRRYVPNFSAIASPLTDTTKKGKPNVIHWEESQTRAYNTLKKSLISQPVLRLPDFSKEFLLQTDASMKGLGAILLQQYDDEKFPVIFLSRKLLPAEQNYSVVEKECLALVWAIKSLDTYLQGRTFTVLTDHAPLLYLNKAKSDNGRLMRWALLLHQYRFRILSVKGSENHGPDFLSRV